MFGLLSYWTVSLKIIQMLRCRWLSSGWIHRHRCRWIHRKSQGTVADDHPQKGSQGAVVDDLRQMISRHRCRWLFPKNHNAPLSMITIFHLRYLSQNVYPTTEFFFQNTNVSFCVYFHGKLISRLRWHLQS